jgi:hypothetical protein
MTKLFLSFALATLVSALPALAQTAKAPLGVAVRSAAVTAGAAGTASTFTAYDFNWAYAPSLPACVSTNIACYDGFILTNTTLGTVVGTESQIGSSSRSYSYTPAGGIPYGTTNFSLTAHGYDQNGAALTSVPATASVVVAVTTLAAPTGLAVKTQ